MALIFAIYLYVKLRSHTIMPYFLLYNELAQKEVQIGKQIMMNTTDTNEDFGLGSLNYGCSLLEDGRSPRELRISRILRSHISVFSMEAPLPVDKRCQRTTAGSVKVLLALPEFVRIREHRGWHCKAQVERGLAPRSYLVRTGNVNDLRRIRVPLRFTNDNFEPQAAGSETELAPVSIGTVRGVSVDREHPSTF